MNIYIGNLNNHVSEQQLRKLFCAFGKVNSANIIMDFHTGQSKGFGFVEMEDHADGLNAIKELNNLNYMNQYLEVSEARPKPLPEDRPVIEKRAKAQRGKSGSRDRR